MAGTTFTGTVGRSITDFMGERLSVLAYGAVGDGVTDDSAAINTAIEHLTALNGRKLYLPGGRTYLVNSPVVIPPGISQIWMVGDGDSSIIKKGTSMPTGQGVIDIQGASKITFDSFLVNPNVTTINRTLYSTFGADPSSSLITGDTAFWVHGGSSKLRWRNVTVTHTGGYSIFNDARAGAIDDEEVIDCLFENNRPNLFGIVSGDITGNDGAGNPKGFGGYTGGIFSEGDGTNYSVSNLLVEGCTFRRINGNCLWSHAYALTKAHTNFRYLVNHFEDTGLDAIELGVVVGGEVEGNTGRRIGYCTFDDNSASTPRFLSGKNATGIDSAGLVRGVGYKNNSFASVNGGYIDLDGYSQATVSGNELIMYKSSDPKFTEDRLNIIGPANDGTSFAYGMQISNTNNDPVAGTNVTIEGNTIENMNAGAIRLYAARDCKVMGNNIDHPATASIKPISMGPIGAGVNQRATGNIVTDNVINYNSPSSPVACIFEDPSIAAFTSADKNWVFGNTLLGSNVYEFYRDANSSSAVSIIFSSGQSALTDISINLVQREGIGSSAVLRVYSQEGSGNSAQLLLNLQDYSNSGNLRGPWSSGTTYTTADIVTFSGFRYYAIAGSTGVAPGSDPTKWVIASPLLNISSAGQADTGVIATGNRLSSVVSDAIVTGKLYGDSFLALATTTYSDADANLLPNTVALLRFKPSVGVIEQSVSVSGGARVWSALGVGGASAAGPTNAVQFNAGSSVLGGSGNLEWLGAAGLAITVSGVAGVTVAGGYVQAAGFVSTLNSWEAINGATSGSGAYLAGLISTAFGSTGGYFNLNAIGYATYPVPLTGLSSFGGTDVLLWASNGNGTTSPLTSVSLNTNTFVNAAAGFFTPSSAANAIQAPSGGVLAQSIALEVATISGTDYPTATFFAPSGPRGRVFGPVGPSGNLFMSENLSYNGTTWNVDGTSGSYSMIQLASVASGAITFAIYNGFVTSNPVSLGASLAMNTIGNTGLQASPSASAGVTLTVGGTSGVAGLVVTGGFIQSAQGFFSSVASVTAINIPSGGAQFGMGVEVNQGYYMKALGATPSTSVLPNAPAGYGCIAYDGGSTILYWNGSSYSTFNFATAGGGGVTSLTAGTAISISASTGAVTITNTGVTALFGTSNEVIVSASSGSITLSLPQAIHTGANVDFNALACTASNFNAIQCTSGGISSGTGSLGGFYVGLTQVINNVGTVVAGVTTTSGISAAGYNVTGGFSGQTWTINIAAGFTITGVGTFHNLVFKGGVLVSAS